uniref:Uncharacterized protein n=1 Tax=Ditylenchus dipsaci TaxID=166011 RepID=A0A915DTC7_9BILA
MTSLLTTTSTAIGMQENVVAVRASLGPVDLFGRLSPIVDSEDDCEQENESNERRIVLRLEVVDTFELAPWIDATEFPFNNPFRPKPPTFEIGIQTKETHGPLIDK